MKKTIAAVVLALSLAVGYGYLTEASASAKIFPGTSTTDTVKNLPNGPANIGHMGFVPTTEGVAVVCTDGTIEDYIETLQGISLDAITLTGEDMKTFYFSNSKVSITDWPAEIVSIVVVDPTDKDWKGDTIYLAAYDKDGCYWGQAAFSVEDVVNGLKAIGRI